MTVVGTYNAKMEQLKERVLEALNDVKPFLEADGGDIELVNITDDLEVQVRLLGNCETCPMSISTMKAGVERSIKNAIPEITSVIAVNESV